MYIYIYNWLVVSTPLKNISQLGTIIPNIWENKSHVPNHQPDKYSKWFTQLETSKKDVRLPRLIMKELIIIQDYKVVPPRYKWVIKPQ